MDCRYGSRSWTEVELDCDSNVEPCDFSDEMGLRVELLSTSLSTLLSIFNTLACGSSTHCSDTRLERLIATVAVLVVVPISDSTVPVDDMSEVFDLTSGIAVDPMSRSFRLRLLSFPSRNWVVSSWVENCSVSIAAKGVITPSNPQVLLVFMLFVGCVRLYISEEISSSMPISKVYQFVK